MEKQKRFWVYPLMALGLALSLASSCKKDEKEVPSLTTTEITSITPTTAASGGTVTSDGGEAITELGVCYGTTQNPNIASSKVVADATAGSYTCSLVGLDPATTYYVRAYATNSVGTAYGNEVSFTTSPPVLPSLNTAFPLVIAITTATIGGSVTADGFATITEQGICYSTTQSPTTANSKVAAVGTAGPFKCSLVGLAPATTYYVRAYATNSVGTAYGEERTFTTCSTDAITDADGNYYNQVTIGNQVWLKENLRTTKYSNGDPIANVTDNTQWQNQTAGAYSWYNNDEATYKSTYGALYNWYTVDDARKLCPIGWHVPTDNDWYTLEAYIGGEVGGGKLKEAGTAHWLSPNTDATNTTGFSALPGGYRYIDGSFLNLGYDCKFWISYRYSATMAYVRNLTRASGDLGLGISEMNRGYSVRCVKD